MEEACTLIEQPTTDNETKSTVIANKALDDHPEADKGPADKLNHLIDLVGELVIASASASLLAHRSGQTVLAEANSAVSQLVESIRDAALQMRMQKIGASFDQVQAAAHEAAQTLGKEIALQASGTETELDRSVAEQIGAPLLQLVRYALAQGIEPADAREARGKPAAGQFELKAFHDSASIVIEVADDGAGLNPDAIRAKAIEKGLLSPDQTPVDDDLLNLIFETDLHEVKKAILALRGEISVSSEVGVGSCFAIRLPLTLAIIDGFLTGVGQSSYVIPLDTVVECLELTNVSTDRDYINLRGEVLPYVHLRDLFEVPGERPPRENVVVVQYAGQKAGIVVDQLLGEFQTVIKPLGTLFHNIHGIGGSTILGSGEVALILDVPALISRCAQVEEQQLEHSASKAVHE